MRAFSVVIIAFAAILAVASAVPVAEDIPSEYLRQENDTDVAVDEPLQVDTIESLAPVENGGRFRRATCDLLSVDLPFIKVNHAACAAHCLAKRKGYKGGYCKRAVCHCRR